jgi:hypothetical protein
VAVVAKTVITIGDRLFADAERLIRRRKPPVAWLELLKPIVARASNRAGQGGRFDRHDGVPRTSHVAPPPPDRLVAEEVADAGEPLAPTARDRLRPLVGPAADRARVHTDGHADSFTRSQRARAVTVGEDIFFRSGAYAPQSATGVGLIVHELTHVAESVRPGVDRRRAMPDGVRDEERLARGHERSVIQGQLSPVVAPAYLARREAGPSPASPSVATGGQSPNLRPMRADDEQPLPAAPPPRPPSGPSPDVIQRTLVRDMMKQLRIEFERGA